MYALMNISTAILKHQASFLSAHSLAGHECKKNSLFTARYVHLRYAKWRTHISYIPSGETHATRLVCLRAHFNVQLNDVISSQSLRQMSNFYKNIFNDVVKQQQVSTLFRSICTQVTISINKKLNCNIHLPYPVK